MGAPMQTTSRRRSRALRLRQARVPKELTDRGVTVCKSIRRGGRAVEIVITMVARHARA